MKKLATFSLMLIMSITMNLSGQTRFSENLCNDWLFKGSSIRGDSIREVVTLPHTWNSQDAQAGFEYYRGTGIYTKKLRIDKKYQGKRLFLRFEGVHTVADVSLNGVHLGQHRGGYSAFVYEITAQAKIGVENILEVKVDNRKYDDILPLGGDFNMYGGIYRPVSLLTTDQICITPLDYSSPGVYIKQSKVTASEADIEILSRISNGSVADQSITVVASVFDKEGNVTASQKSALNIAAGKNSEATISLSLLNPKLWNGRTSPYLYKVKVELFSGSQLIDEVIQPLGLRSFSVDPDKGFYLNGNHLALHGVSRHQDRKDKGSAISEADHRNDMQIITEMGANALRLAHYQQSEYFYSLADSAGMVVWAEIPFVGSMMGGRTNSLQFDENARLQLTELIRQNFNHPSICFWGVFNELSNPVKDSPAPLVKELTTLAKKEDPTRLVTAASLLPDGDELNFITDLIGWNKYFGWYYGSPKDLGKWADQQHKKFPQLRLAITEYGAGGSILQHEDKMGRPFPIFHPWHPEGYQAWYHEQSWKAINERPFIWGTYVWNMFDFSADFRNEGDSPGMNDKGLVTYDRKTKKDAFYLYKVNWNPDPMVHINDQRYVLRKSRETTVKVYSNLESVELFVNGLSAGVQKSADKIFVWKNVQLTKGNNRIKAIGKGEGKTVVDECVWIYKADGWISVLVWFFQYGIIPICLLLVLSIPLLFIKAFKRSKPGWRRKVYKTLFFLVVIVVIVWTIAFLYLLKYDVNLFDYSVL